MNNRLLSSQTKIYKWVLQPPDVFIDLASLQFVHYNSGKQITAARERATGLETEAKRIKGAQ